MIDWQTRKIVDYKHYIKRKIGSLINRENNNLIKNSYSLTGMNHNKEKEIIVYLRNKSGMNKPQLIDFIKETFDIEDEDSERLFYAAFPEGLDPLEERLVNLLNNNLGRLDYLPKEFIDRIFTALLSRQQVQIKEIDPETIDSATLVIGSLLKERKLL
jgi:hypothetical protein